MRSERPKRASVAGFTLLELMITLAVAAILAAAALPSFFSAIERNRIVSQTNELLAAFGTARSEAIRRNAVAGVCARDAAGTGCATDEWNRGWIVWVDVDRDNAFTVADEVIRSSQLSTKDRMTTNAEFNILFGPRGTHVAAGTGSTRSALDVLTLQPAGCKAGVRNVRALTVRTTGSVGTATSPCP